MDAAFLIIFTLETTRAMKTTRLSDDFFEPPSFTMLQMFEFWGKDKTRKPQDEEIYENQWETNFCPIQVLRRD